MIKRTTLYFEDTKEERIAREIYSFILTRNLSHKQLHIEIVDDFYNKNIRFSYRFKPSFNLKLFQICLITLGIKKEIVKKGEKYLVLRQE